MKNVLVIGAGRSATALIRYLLEQGRQHNFFITVADADVEAAKRKIGEHPNGCATWLDASKPADRRDIIARHDIVVSLLPPAMHLEVAQDCITLGKHMATASYVSKQIFSLGDEARHEMRPAAVPQSAQQREHLEAADGCRVPSLRRDGSVIESDLRHCGPTHGV